MLPIAWATTGRAALASTDAEVYASHVSLWEMAIKRGSAKLTPT